MKRIIAIIFFLTLGFSLVSAQTSCFDADASIWVDTWRSCEKTANPKAEYGNSHWVQYDFGAIRTLSKSWVWNTNDPARLNQGFETVKIDYSEDGNDWIYFGEMTFPKAQGNAVYGGFSGPDLVNIQARYVLLTAISNYGDPSCAGIAEIKFNLLPVVEEFQGGGGEGCAGLEPVTEIFVEDVSETEAFIYWDYGEEVEEPFFIFFLREEGTEDPIEIETEDFEIFLEDLKPNTTYEFAVLVFCGEEDLLSEIRTFTTLGPTSTAELEVDQEILSLFPNPTKSQTVMEYYSKESDQLNYSILAADGTEVLQQTIGITGGTNQITIDLKSLPAGLYLLNTNSLNKGRQLSTRIIKISK